MISGDCVLLFSFCKDNKFKISECNFKFFFILNFKELKKFRM